jgi:hypothetical protein
MEVRLIIYRYDSVRIERALDSEHSLLKSRHLQIHVQAMIVDRRLAMVFGVFPTKRSDCRKRGAP